MIIRIVKMSFKPEKVATFLALFEKKQAQIRNFEGCEHLELWQDKNESNIFFTHSHWQSEEHLNKYRHSDFFQATWKISKSLFREKAEAWSLQKTF